MDSTQWQHHYTASGLVRSSEPAISFDLAVRALLGEKP
jgi:hypothetical protein